MCQTFWCVDSLFKLFLPVAWIGLVIFSPFVIWLLFSVLFHAFLAILGVLPLSQFITLLVGEG